MSSGFLDSLTWRPHEEEVTLCICHRVGVEGTAPADTSLIDTPTYSIFCPSCCTQQKRVPETDTLLIYCKYIAVILVGNHRGIPKSRMGIEQKGIQ